MGERRANKKTKKKEKDDIESREMERQGEMVVESGREKEGQAPNLVRHQHNIYAFDRLAVGLV